MSEAVDSIDDVLYGLTETYSDVTRMDLRLFDLRKDREEPFHIRCDMSTRRFDTRGIRAGGKELEYRLSEMATQFMKDIARTVKEWKPDGI